ncbi:hypothetical protein F5X68DRAFT_38363 [Plectosphaerella plurivora]|uniref:Uncharacterized protein n=1 Tax=Plectosphaerella plurivora TaxID=936078 RepID=A0A9P8V4Y8_9PEZI|nr:hypothetical protein F5X68DRAFT_38363 [Plectosphaerella plurivora]
MSARRDSGQPRRNYDWTARRDDERSPRDRDLPLLDTRGRPREADERGRPMNDSPVRFRDSRQSGGGGPAPPSAGTSSNGDQPTHQSVEKQLVDHVYQAYSNLAKQASLRVVFADLDRELKQVTADRDEIGKSRYDDFASSRETLNRKKDALEAKLKKCKQDMNENKLSIGKRAHDFVATLIPHVSGHAKTPTASPAHNPNLINKSDLEALEKKLSGRLAAYYEKLAEQHTIITEQASRISLLEVDTKRKEEVISQQGLSLSTLQLENTHFQAEIKQLQNRVLTLESGVPQSRSEIGALQATSRDLERQFNAQDNAVKNLNSGHATLRDTVERLQASHDARTMEVNATISEQATTLGRRIQNLADSQDKAPKLQEALQGFSQLQSKMQDLEGTVKAIENTIGELKAVPAPAAASASTTTTTTTGSNATGEELSKLRTDLKRLQIDHEQKMSRKEVEENMAKIKTMVQNSFNGLVERFGGFIDEHDTRLQSIETAAKEKKEEDDKAAQVAQAAAAEQNSTSTAGATAKDAEAVSETALVEAKAEELAATKLKEELDLLNAHLNSTRQELEKCQEGLAGLTSAFGSLHQLHEESQQRHEESHQRHEESHAATFKIQKETTEMVEVLKHAVQSLSSQFNNMSTEELCKRILRHVGVLGSQKTAEEMTRRMDSLERAVQSAAGINGADAGNSKKRKTSAQTSGLGGAGPANARVRPG